VQGYYIFRGRENDLGTAILVSNMIPATNTSQQQSYVFVDSEIYEDGIITTGCRMPILTAAALSTVRLLFNSAAAVATTAVPTFRSALSSRLPIPIPSIPAPASPMTWLRMLKSRSASTTPAARS
jgi:hypothetical protein